MFSALENKIMEVLPMLNGKKIIIWGYGKSEIGRASCRERV